MSLTPSFIESLTKAIDARTSDVQVMLPGKITAWNATTQKASVRPLLKRPYEDEEGNRQTEELPEIHDVPLCFPGLGAVRLTSPVPLGTTVALLFASASLDLWLTRGGTVDPNDDDRRGHLSDCIAVPGLYDFGHLPTTAPTDAVVFHTGGNTLRLVTDTANDPVVRKSDLQDFIDDYKVHTHATAGTGTPSPPSNAGSVSATGSPDVKVP